MPQLARAQGWEWHEYPASTVLASVRLRGVKGRPSKQVIAQGVAALYGSRTGGWPQDVLDAVAVGVCHLNQEREATVEEVEQ